MQNSISQRGERKHYDAVIIGSGIAGLCCLLELVKVHPCKQFALVTKGNLNQSNSWHAQGGIAAANSSADIHSHIADTLSAGDGLCNVKVVEAMLSEGPAAIQYLIEQNVVFDNDCCGREAGHTTRRIYHVGDRTGAAIMEALIRQIQKYSQIHIYENHTAVNLITQGREVLGAYILSESTGLIHTFLSNTMLLATGGAGKVYRYTTNPDEATGDGVAMAYRAGARIEGLEFYQFHPTLLYHKQQHKFLISEALRGEGAYLRLPDTQERFMQRYSPAAMELATRDVVSRAIFSEIENSQHDYVYLDVRHLDKSFLQKRFPLIFETLNHLGLDLSRDLIPVVPAAHYMGGGVLTDLNGKTDLQRLFAIGETACTGLHGANRLASNSLLEGIIMGRNAARNCALDLNNAISVSSAIKDWDSATVVDLRRASQINVHWRGLRGEMSSYAGIVRTAAGLRDQLKLVLARKEIIEEYYWKHSITRDLVELRNIVLMAELIVRSALNRHESRGGHYREDTVVTPENAPSCTA